MAKKSKNVKTNQGKAPEEWKKKKPVNPNSKAAVSQKKRKNKEPKKGKDGKAAKPSLWRRFVNYIKAVKAEMQRVVWPTKEELLSASLIVVGALIFFGVLIFAVDNIIVIPLDWVASLNDTASSATSTAVTGG